EKRQTEANDALAKARTLMKSCEDRFRQEPSDPQLYLRLVEATRHFNRWLEDNPEDAAVYVERSRAYELRRDFERALSDMDRAIALRKDLALNLDAKLQELRLQVARPKQ